MKVKKFITLVLAGVMCVGLSACSTSNNDKGKDVEVKQEKAKKEVLRRDPHEGLR